jgi:hypothetical protein
MKIFIFIVRELKHCFGLNTEKMVTFALMGDSRVRNLYEYFEFLMEGNFTPWAVKPHHNLNISYPESNFKVDFLWGPQMETGNPKVFPKREIYNF